MFTFLVLAVLPVVHIAATQTPWFYFLGNVGALLGGLAMLSVIDRLRRKMTVPAFYTLGQRQIPAGRRIVNVGAIGRPPNDGQTTVWYARLSIYPGQSRVGSELLPVAYDYERLAYEMRQEGLPEEFVKTILTGWWTTCLKILPSKVRARGVSESVFSMECIYLKTVRRNSHDYDR